MLRKGCYKILSIFNRLKSKWNIQSNKELVLILIVFSLSGMSILPVRHAIFWIFGYTSNTPLTLKVITWLIFIFPLYQVFLLIYGLLLGQFSFFWQKEKRMIQWIRNKIH